MLGNMLQLIDAASYLVQCVHSVHSVLLKWNLTLLKPLIAWHIEELAILSLYYTQEEP